MANTEDRKLGPSEVEQSKNAHEIFDENDDLKEYQPSQTTLEKKQEKLDRGEELYTGFGFDSDRGRGERLLGDDLNTAKVPSPETHTPSAQTRQNTFESSTGTESDSRLSSSNVKVSNNQRVEPSTPYTTTRTVTKSASREVPEETKLIIEPQGGEFRYKERTPDYNRRRDRDVYYYNSNEEAVDANLGDYRSRVDESGLQHIPADYELTEVHYDIDPRSGQYYHLANGAYITDYDHIETLPIKHHYKLKRKEKKGLPWTKIALGVAAVAGLGLLFMADEDDGPFWS